MADAAIWAVRNAAEDQLEVVEGRYPDGSRQVVDCMNWPSRNSGSSDWVD